MSVEAIASFNLSNSPIKLDKSVCLLVIACCEVAKPSICVCKLVIELCKLVSEFFTALSSSSDTLSKLVKVAAILSCKR